MRPFFVVFAGLEQLGGTKQATDMVGAERRSHFLNERGLNHRFQLTRHRRARVAVGSASIGYRFLVLNWY